MNAAVIGEFNPFHGGHAALFRRLREAGAERIFVLMSGDYVQRGAPAIVDGRARAEMALLEGADIAAAFPARYASSTAESFAFHAVQILEELRASDCLAFGSECGELSVLEKCAEALEEEPPAFRAALRAGIRAGLSYPAARAQAMPEYAALLAHPNNILAVEYLRALRRTGSKMKPLTFPREGSGYHELSLEKGTPSASGIRRALAGGAGPAAVLPGGTVPPAALGVLEREWRTRGFLCEDDLSALLLEKISAAEDPRDLAVYAEVSDELASRILRMRGSFRSFSLFADSCRSRSLPRTSVSRALLHIALDLRKETGADGAHAVQILGYRTGARDYLREILGNAVIPCILDEASFRKTAPGPALDLLREERRVSNLYEALRSSKSGHTIRREAERAVLRV